MLNPDDWKVLSDDERYNAYLKAALDYKELTTTITQLISKQTS